MSFGVHWEANGEGAGWFDHEGVGPWMPGQVL